MTAASVVLCRLEEVVQYPSFVENRVALSEVLLKQAQREVRLAR